MAKFCLPKHIAAEFLEKVRSGEYNPAKLAAMSSLERRELFSELFGDETARQVNALFESKLLLKHQKRGMVTWAKNVSGLSDLARRDMVSRINRLEKVLDPDDQFFQDLANQKLGLEVTQGEAQEIFNLAKTTEDLRKAIPEDSPIRSKERLEYGMAQVMFQKYMDSLKIEANKKQLIDFVKNPKEIIIEAAGFSKSVLASLDNSFWGRQGVKMLLTNPKIWTKNFAKSFGDIGKELRGVDAIDHIKADIFSRPNAVDGSYKKMKLDVGLDAEEAFPSSLPERIPLFGRLFKASEAAYNGAALRLRADYADKLIEMAEKNEAVNLQDTKELLGIGRLINSSTGRGSLGKWEVGAKEMNVLFFSIKFLKANWDTITAHAFDKKSTKFSRKVARANLAKIIAGFTAVLAMSSAVLGEDSVEWDPRSSNFGKIKVKDTRFDITGGMGPLISLFSRVVPTTRNGEFGFWFKSSTTGKWTNLFDKKYGQRSALDIVEDFFENKTSPLASILRDVWRGEKFGGEKPTLQNSIESIIVPIPIKTGQELIENEDSANNIMTMILEHFGIGSSTY